MKPVQPWVRGRPATGRLEHDKGSATVELAAAIPLLVAVTLAMVGILALARDQVLAQGAAREAAREAAIGGDATRASAAARAALPPGRAARITVAAAGSDRVQVTVGLPVTLPFRVSPIMIRATAVAAREPGPPPIPATPEPGQRRTPATPEPGQPRTLDPPAPGPPSVPAGHQLGSPATATNR